MTRPCPDCTGGTDTCADACDQTHPQCTCQPCPTCGGSASVDDVCDHCGEVLADLSAIRIEGVGHACSLRCALELGWSPPSALDAFAAMFVRARHYAATDREAALAAAAVVQGSYLDEVA